MAAKPLSEYPRPPEDNGRGVHWSASVYHPTGAALQRWIGELQAMQVKWLKLLDDGGGSSLEICRALLDNGIMPIVRMYRERPNPGRIGGREKGAIRSLIDIGVPYFETNNEPNLRAEWQDDIRPGNWLDIVVDNFIYDARFILGEGGYPALPSMGPSSQADAIRKVVEKGQGDIFELGGWMAIHNYTLNHPLDYPSDEVNQTGKALTVEEFDQLKQWQYSHLSPEEAAQHGISRADYDKYQGWAWDGRNLDMVNVLRAEKKNPGFTVFDDSNCFRGFEVWGHRVYNALGYYVPIMSTEGGPVVGWGDDKRYAKLNPVTQAAWQMEINRFMQDEAPEWYFTCCTWLLASKPLGDWNPTWDQMSWFTNAWDVQFGLEGELPLVRMMKDTPAQIRHELRPDQAPSLLSGQISGRDGLPLAGIALSLRDVAGVWDETRSDQEGRYRLQAPPGQYDLWVAWYGPVAHDIMLGEADEDAIDLPDFDAPGQFVISGQVLDENGKGQGGLRVALRRNGLEHAFTTADAAGVFSFAPKLAGSYALEVVNGSAAATVGPDDPLAEIEIRVPAPPDPKYVLTEKRLLSAAETGNRRLIYGRVRDALGRGLSDIEVEMRWTNPAPGARFPRTRTGQNPFIPDPTGYFEFLHSPGEFLVEVVQGDYDSDIASGLLTANVPGRVGDPITYEVNFQLQGAATIRPGQSRLSGSVPGGRTGQVVQLWNRTNSIDAVLDASRQFQFKDLPAGAYDLFLAGIGVIASDIVLDGGNAVEIETPLLGAIVGRVQNASPSQRGIALVSETYGFSRRAVLDAGGVYRFTNLPGGRYRVEVGDAMLSGLRCDGQSVLHAPDFDVSGSPARLIAISGVVTVRESGQPLADVVVSLLRGDTVIAETVSDDQGRYQIVNVAAGVYALAVQGEVVAAEVTVEGLRDLVVDLAYSLPTSDHSLPRYYWLRMADADLHPASLRVLAPWFAVQPTGVVGFSLSEAQKSATVVAIGDGISNADLEVVSDAGARAIDLRHDLLTLAAMVADDLQGEDSNA
ncbi:MAG: carboxypeptidase regulatory-like domain-containing protein [Caldilineales bacterium]|nr:carboxypeptidase regulatory-like domain-containing protein [Caldilineales bacterium]